MIISTKRLPGSWATYLCIIGGVESAVMAASQRARTTSLPVASWNNNREDAGKMLIYMRGKCWAGNRKLVARTESRAKKIPINRQRHLLILLTCFAGKSVALSFFSAAAGSQISSFACPFYSCPAALLAHLPSCLFLGPCVVLRCAIKLIKSVDCKNW